MKKVKTILKNLLDHKWIRKAKEIIQIIGFFFVDTFGWCRSLFIYLFAGIKYPRLFYGYCNLFWSEKFAEKRTSKWPPRWDQMGKQQGTFPYDDLTLLVCSRMELINLQKKGMIRKELKPRKAIKKSYYTTTL